MLWNRASRGTTISGSRHGAPVLGAAEDEEAVVVAAGSEAGREWPGTSRQACRRTGGSTPRHDGERSTPSLRGSEAGRVSPGPGRQQCRETRDPMRNTSAVVGEAPPVLGAAGDEEAAVVAAGLETDRVRPGTGRPPRRGTRSPLGTTLPYGPREDDRLVSLVLAASPVSPLQCSDEAVGLRDRGHVAATGVESQVLDNRAPPTGTRLQRTASAVGVDTPRCRGGSGPQTRGTVERRPNVGMVMRGFQAGALPGPEPSR
jgi:hypothetical protein